MQEIAGNHFDDLFSSSFPKEHYENRTSIYPTFDIVEAISNNHIMEVGRTGSGKGLNLSNWIEKLYEAGYKVVSIYNQGPAIEHAYKFFPAEGRYADFLSKMHIKPEKYPVGVHFQVCKGFIPKKVPDFFNPYSIPLSGSYPQLNPKLLSLLSPTGLTEVAQKAFDVVLRKGFRPNDNLANLYYAITKIVHEGHTELNLPLDTISDISARSMHRVFETLLEYRLISSKNFKYALTNKYVKDLLNNQKEISVFTQAFLPPDLEAFNVLLLLEYISHNVRFCRHPLVIVATEIQSIMQNTEDQNYSTAINFLSRWMSKFLRQSRKYNIRFIGDTQILSDINPKFVLQALLVAFNMDLDENEYKSIKTKVPKEQLKDIRDLLHSLERNSAIGRFEYYIPEHGKYYVELPRTAHPFEGNKSDFMKFAKKRYGTHNQKDTSEIIKEIEQAILKTADSKSIKGYIEGASKSKKKIYQPPNDAPTSSNNINPSSSVKTRKLEKGLFPANIN